MIARIILIGASTLLLVSGCAPWVSTSELLPRRGVVPPDDGRLDPWVRWASFERQFLSGKRGNEVRENYVTYSDAAQLLFPLSTRIPAAWSYVSLGRDFATQGELGGAARAYWAALTLAPKMVGSRPDRERVRQAAYRGLADVATRRGQSQWAELLGLCAAWADVYLKSSQSGEDDRVFYNEIDRVRRREGTIENTRQMLERQRALGALSVGITQLQASAAGQAGNLQEALRLNVEALRQGATAGAQQAEASRALEAAMARAPGDLRALVSDDVAEVEAGQSFAAHELLFFLTTAADPIQFLPPLESFARDKPPLREAVAALRQGPRDADRMLTAAQELQKREVFVARYERRGLQPPR